MEELIEVCLRMTTDFIYEIEQCENDATETIEKIQTFEESSDRLNEIMAGTDLQVLYGKEEAYDIVDYLLPGYNDISRPIGLENEDRLAEIFQIILSNQDFITDWRDDDDEEIQEVRSEFYSWIVYLIRFCISY